MADISLHYSSKAPLAGTFTAFNQIFGDLAPPRPGAPRACQPRPSHDPRSRPQPERRSSSRPTSPSGASDLQIRSGPVSLPCAGPSLSGPWPAVDPQPPCRPPAFSLPPAPLRPPGGSARAARVALSDQKIQALGRDGLQLAARGDFAGAEAAVRAGRRGTPQFRAAPSSPGSGPPEARPLRRRPRAAGTCRLVPAAGCRGTNQSRGLPRPARPA